jgi:ABC-type Fe3+/spermidine/putrescine transport system ATPase subunit
LCLSSSAGAWLARSGRQTFPDGAKVNVAVRPEKVRLGEWPSDIAVKNVFYGRLKESTYLGAAVEYRVE